MSMKYPNLKSDDLIGFDTAVINTDDDRKGGDVRINEQNGFKGNATFNASGLSKQDIMAWEPFVKINVTWTDDGIVNEKIIPEANK